MKVKVEKGTVVYKGEEYQKGTSFECEKATAENLLKANIVSIVETVKKPARAKKED